MERKVTEYEKHIETKKNNLPKNSKVQCPNLIFLESYYFVLLQQPHSGRKANNSEEREKEKKINNAWYNGHIIG